MALADLNRPYQPMSTQTYPQYFLWFRHIKGIWHIRQNDENTYSIYEQGAFTSLAEPVLTKNGKFNPNHSAFGDCWLKVSEEEFLAALTK